MMSQSGCGLFRAERWSCLVLLSALMVSSVGCGGGAQAPVAAGMTEDQKAVNSLVGSINDYASSMERLKSRSAKGKVLKPAEAAKFSGTTVTTDGDIAVTGDSASVPVAIIKYDANGNAQAPVKQTWKFVKEGGEWKYAETPF